MTLIDVIFAGVLTFVVIPVGLFIVGLGLTFLAEAVGFGKSIADVVTGIGLLGLWAWIGAPALVVFGWVAARSGWIGWASAPLVGALGGVATGAAMMMVEGETILVNDWAVPLILALPSALFGAMGWTALRYLRPDVYLSENEI